MKKILFGFVAMLTALSMFSSCEDEDSAIAITLSGEWEGDFGAFYTISVKGSEPREYQAEYSHLEFEPRYEYATEGTGYEVDYYGSGPYDYLSYDFYWEVHEGVISLEFYDNDDMDFDITDYKMNSDYFRGYIFNEPFRLKKTADHYDWETYKTFKHSSSDIDSEHDMTRGTQVEFHAGHKMK